MAIEKTFLNNNMATLKTYLENNAVPEYFDRITMENNFDYYKISCYIGSSVFLTIEYNEKLIIKIKSLTINGKTTNKFSYATKCKNGIMFLVNGGDSAFALTKDNDGNTVVLLVSDLKINRDSTVNSVYAVSPKTGSVKSNKIYCDTVYEMTSLSNIVVGDNTNYTPNAFIMLYRQINSEMPISVNGEAYLSNGVWCIKDE